MREGDDRRGMGREGGRQEKGRDKMYDLESANKGEQTIRDKCGGKDEVIRSEGNVNC